MTGKTRGKPHKTHKINRVRIDPLTKLARSILPDAQARHGDYAVHDVANHSDSDQRSMVRSGETRTIRKMTRIEKLHRRNVIDAKEAAACEWYAVAHALRYDTTGITANYGTTSKSGNSSFDHLPKTYLQEEAFHNFSFARAGINPFLVGMFDRVVLDGRPLGMLARSFRLAARQLLDRIAGRVAL